MNNNENYVENEASKNALQELPEYVEIIGVTFRSAGKIYYFDANGIKASDANHVIVDTARGYEYGKVALANRMVASSELVLPLRKVLRIADKNDDLRYKVNCEKEEEAFSICMKKIVEHELDMKLIDVEYTFDNAKLLFYFTSEDRVDFRELVKDLASVFRTRIELRQIGLRDETKIMGGFGICGREFCCHSFLGDFVQVSIKMAKEQNLSLNSSKISGSCGRLMCCLRYEHETYQEELKKTPKVDSSVMTPDGPGTVVDVQVLSGLVKVKLDKDPDGSAVVYDRGLLKNKNGEYICPRSEEGELVADSTNEEKSFQDVQEILSGENDGDEIKATDNYLKNKNRNKKKNKKKTNQIRSGEKNTQEEASPKAEKAIDNESKPDKTAKIEKKNVSSQDNNGEKNKVNSSEDVVKKSHHSKRYRKNYKNRRNDGEKGTKGPENNKNKD